MNLLEYGWSVRTKLWNWTASGVSSYITEEQIVNMCSGTPPDETHYFLFNDLYIFAVFKHADSGNVGFDFNLGLSSLSNGVLSMSQLIRSFQNIVCRYPCFKSIIIKLIQGQKERY